MAYQTVALTDYLDSVTEVTKDANFVKVLSLLPALNKKGPWLAGGSVRKFLSGEPNYADYDLFFSSQQQCDEFCNQLLMAGAVEDGVNIFNRAFTLEGYKIQAIHHEFRNTLIQTMDRFDMTICQFGFDGTHFVWSSKAAQDVKNKEFHFLDTTDPVYNLNRAFKYAREGGFKPADGEVKKVLNRIAQGKATVKNARKISGGGVGQVVVTLDDNFLPQGGAAFIGKAPHPVPMPLAFHRISGKALP